MQNKTETRKAGIVKAFMYLAAAAVVYTLVFTNQQKLLVVLSRKDYVAPIFTMSFTVFIAMLYGTATSKFLKHTLEYALKSQCKRGE